MSGRYQQSGRGRLEDAAVVSDLDSGFAGVDMRLDPGLLPSGVCSAGVNLVFRQGVAEPRRGFQTRPWAQLLGVSFPISFPFDFTEELGFGTVYGAGVFSDPNGQEWAVLACETTAYQISWDGPAQALRYPSGVTVTDRVTFTQAFNVLLMWRGEGLDPLAVSTGTSFGEEIRFELVPDETNGDYTSTIPDAARGLHYGNRVWVGYRGSKVAYSDVLAYTRWDGALSSIYVNDGSDDRLQVLVAYGTNAILAFKDQSIFAITGVLPSPGDTGAVQVVTNERGTIAPESVVQVGNDVWFLSDDGVYAISQALEGTLRAASEPVSAPMGPLFQRVHWGHAHKAVGTFHDGRYLLALPIDGAAHNNAIAVYDFQNQGWAGWWEFDLLDAAWFVRLTVGGRRRLAVVSGTAISGNEGAVYVLGDDFMDESFGTESAVETELVTRGYLCGSNGQKVFIGAAVEVATWYGAGEISAVRDGVNEEADAQTFAKDRTVYATFDKGPYVESNENDDHGDPYREDYSVVIPTGGLRLGSGVCLGLHQTSSERMRVRQRGRHLQIRVRGTRGRVAVRAVQVDARAGAEPLREVY